jgi:hypothetical protein
LSGRPAPGVYGALGVGVICGGLLACSVIYDFDRPIPPNIASDLPLAADANPYDGVIPILPADAGPSVDAMGNDPGNALCPRLGRRRGNVIVISPEQVDSLPGLVAGAAPDTTIELMRGTYVLDVGLEVQSVGLILRSSTGNRDSVVIDGSEHAGVGTVITVASANVTIADLTIANAAGHAIHVHPPADDPGEHAGPLIYNVRIADSRSDAIRVDSEGDAYMDNGTIGCSLVELTSAGRPGAGDDCLMGGIVLSRARGWRIHDNTVRGVFCIEGLALHGIHASSESAGTVIEGNRVLDCARGIGVGLYGEGVATRPLEGSTCGDASYVDDNDSVVRNNFVAANDPRLLTSPGGFEHGIGVWNACNASIYHNTVFSPRAPVGGSIDVRFANSTARLKNNLLSHEIRVRDEAQLVVEGNLEEVTEALFVDPSVGNLHLIEGAEAKDRGVNLGVESLTLDIDGQPRNDGQPDPGADEL